MHSECDQHKFPFHWSGDPDKPYVVVKCHHRSNRFVVHIRDAVTDDYHIVDYVQQEPFQLLETTDFSNGTKANLMFNQLVNRMRSEVK